MARPSSSSAHQQRNQRTVKFTPEIAPTDPPSIFGDEGRPKSGPSIAMRRECHQRIGSAPSSASVPRSASRRARGSLVSPRRRSPSPSRQEATDTLDLVVLPVRSARASTTDDSVVDKLAEQLSFPALTEWMHLAAPTVIPPTEVVQRDGIEGFRAVTRKKERVTGSVLYI
jgi:hypothetical protein